MPNVTMSLFSKAKKPEGNAGRIPSTKTAVIPSATECPICMEAMPTSVAEREACENGHVFCASCIRRAAAVQAVGSRLRCPLCRTGMQTARCEGRPVAKAKTVLVCFDHREKRTTSVPQEWRDALERLKAPSATNDPNLM